MRRISLIAFALSLTACGAADPNEEADPSVPTPPGTIPDDERPSDPGSTVDPTEPGSVATARAELQTALTGVKDATAESLGADFALQHTELGYDPTTAAHLDLIQASALALTDAELAKLGSNGFVISTRQEFPAFGYGYEAIYGADLPVYVSADSVLEAVHRSYDDILQAVEVEALIPALGSLLDGMRENLGAAAGLGERARKDADFYLAVARGLLEGGAAAPVAGADAALVQSFVTKATAASGMENIELFGVKRDIDFSQFTPRGHYTDSEELERYFRAMMWLGRIDFRLLETQPDGSQVFHRSQFDAMVALASLLGEAELAEFARLDQTIETFVGVSDYMTLPEVGSLLSDLGAEGPETTGALDDATIAQAIVNGGYGAQSISSHIMFNGLAEGTLPLSASFALLGQRYVIDSHVFSNVVYDRVAGGTVKRMMPDPLDVAFAALSNDQAVLLLGPELERYAYAADLASMRLLADAHGQDFWDANLYNLWLGSLRALSPVGGEVANPGSVGLPTVTGTEAWGRRILQTQLASWAELRHDTILYAKQSYTAGIACEFPDAYVDPYPEFYEKIAQLADAGTQVVEVALGQSPTDLGTRVVDYFSHLSEVARTLGGMAESQRTGTPFTDAQMAFINDAVVMQIEGCGWPVRTAGWYGQLYFDTLGASEFDPTIADVHTQPTDEGGAVVGRVLHVGTGRPRLMIVTADTCSGPRAYAGLASSYYERVTEDFERLTDESWSAEFRPEPPQNVDWVEPILSQ